MKKGYKKNDAGEQSQLSFIADRLREGNKRNEIMAKFGKKWPKVPSRTFDRRLKAANTIVQAEQQAIKEQARVEVRAEVERLKSSIMGTVERKAYLSEIVKGNVKISVKKPMYDPQQKKFVGVPVEEVPDHAARIRAIQELNKMEGDYAPQRIDATVNKIGKDAVEEVYEGE